MNTYKLFLAGDWVETRSGSIIDDVNPWDGSVYAKVHTAGPEEVEQAIAAAVAAKGAWAALHMSEREKILLKAADYIEANLERFGNVLVNESGSCIMKAMDEVAQTVQIARSAAAECRREFGGVTHTDGSGDFSYWFRKPLGIVAGIAPFNYPFLLAATKVLLALAAGNCFLLKPSSDTPIAGLLIAECLEAAGLPKGVLSVIPGAGSVVGNALVEDERIAMVTFTGSTVVGKRIAQQAAKTLKRVTLEMGGKGPCIVLRDFDVDQAVNISMFGAYFHQGQICMANTRQIVEAPIYDEFCEKMAARVRKLKIGRIDDPGAVIGPLIHAEQCALIDAQIKDALDKGARLLVGGTHEGPFYAPTLLADVTPEMTIFHEESFGPVTSIIRAEDEEDALALANNSKYGLSAALFTNDIKKVFTIAPRMESGMIHINDSTVIGARSAPFGGVKMSGRGREGGHFSIEEFSEIKWVTIRYEDAQFPPM